MYGYIYHVFENLPFRKGKNFCDFLYASLDSKALIHRRRKVLNIGGAKVYNMGAGEDGQIPSRHMTSY